MTINAISAQSLTLAFSATSVSLTRSGLPSPPAASSNDTGPNGDTAPIVAPPAAGTTTAVAPPDGATPLFTALDRNGDGSISREEFVSGARDLLARAGSRHHHHHHGHGDRIGGHHAGRPRLASRLARLFSAVDANGDGTVDQSELAGALTQARAGQAAPGSTGASGNDIGAAQPTTAAVSTAPTSTGGTSATLSITTITVTVAIQQYTAVSLAGAPAAPSAISASA